MYTLWRVWAQVYIMVSRTPVTMYILVCTSVQNTSAVFHPPYNMYACTHAKMPGMTVWQRLPEELMMQMQEALHVSSVRHNQRCDHAPSRQHPLICTGAEPTCGRSPQRKSHFLHFCGLSDLIYPKKDFQFD